MMMADERWMRQALELATASLELGEVPVGCVFIDANDNVVAKGRNRPNETHNVLRALLLSY